MEYMSSLLNALERYRVIIGTLLSLALLGVGAILVWIDWHPPTVQTVTTERVISTTKELPASVTAEAKSSAETNVTVKAVSNKVNINTASQSELDQLPGIGPTYATRIVEYRETNGAFGDTHDIVKVKGIGESTYAKIKDRIVVEGD